MAKGAGNGRIRKRPGDMFLFRVLSIAGLGLIIVSLLLMLGVVLLEGR